MKVENDYFYSHSVLDHSYGAVLAYFMRARENLTATESILSLKGNKLLTKYMVSIC